MRHSGPNTSEGQVICDKRPQTDTFSQLWVALLDTIMIWWSRLSGSLQSAIMGGYVSCTACRLGEKVDMRMEQIETKKVSFERILKVCWVSPLFYQNVHEWTTTKDYIKDIKMGSRNRGQQLNTQTQPSPRPTPLHPQCSEIKTCQWCLTFRHLISLPNHLWS